MSPHPEAVAESGRIQAECARRPAESVTVARVHLAAVAFLVSRAADELEPYDADDTRGAVAHLMCRAAVDHLDLLLEGG